uniref:Gpm519 n=1 Tax=Arundo donax TaxID=35708 RepID=A0A0A9DH60_ARUDO
MTLAALTSLCTLLSMVLRLVCHHHHLHSSRCHPSGASSSPFFLSSQRLQSLCWRHQEKGILLQFQHLVTLSFLCFNTSFP